MLPVVPSRGSVGASGDLAPLAHVAIVLCGEGRATYGGEELDGGEALRRAGLEPIELAAKEGLALINGTHLMAACGALALRDARRLLDAAIVTSALSLEAFMGSTTPFDARIHDLRRHPGQTAVAARLRGLLEGSAIVASHADCGRVQDPYTLRCIPQVLGAIGDALDYAEGVLERELDAVTDNPLLFPDDGEACSGGNFHGQPLSLALDHLGLALCQLASFAERRTYALLSPSYAGLPRFLTPHPGLSSGLMIAQYTQAALVNECQVLAHPAGAGSVPTSAGMEDFNSMGAWAALKARQIVDCAAHVVAIELVCACQGIEFHRPLRSTPALEAALSAVRERIPRLEQDRSLSAEVTALAGALRQGDLTLCLQTPANEADNPPPRTARRGRARSAHPPLARPHLRPRAVGVGALDLRRRRCRRRRRPLRGAAALRRRRCQGRRPARPRRRARRRGRRSSHPSCATRSTA